MQKKYFLFVLMLFLLLPMIFAAGARLNIQSIETQDSAGTFKKTLLQNELDKIVVVVGNSGTGTCSPPAYVQIDIRDINSNNSILDQSSPVSQAVPIGGTTSFIFGKENEFSFLQEELPPNNYKIAAQANCDDGEGNARAFVFSIIEVTETDIPEIPYFFVIIIIITVIAVISIKPGQKKEQEKVKK